MVEEFHEQPGGYSEPVQFDLPRGVVVEATRPGLLEQIKNPAAQSAWEEFYQMYWAVVVRYAQKQGLDEASSQDVLQETMVALLHLLPGFKYDPYRGKFRNFLLTIVHRKVLAARRRAATHRLVSFDTPPHEDGLAPAEVLADEQCPLPSQALENEWLASIQDEAFRRVRDDPTVQGRTWQVFQAYVVEQHPAADVARQFGLAENAIYQIKNRILHRLREEVNCLTSE